MLRLCFYCPTLAKKIYMAGEKSKGGKSGEVPISRHSVTKSFTELRWQSTKFSSALSRLHPKGRGAPSDRLAGIFPKGVPEMNISL
jgi:hypothetical protein